MTASLRRLALSNLGSGAKLVLGCFRVSLLTLVPRGYIVGIIIAIIWGMSASFRPRRASCTYMSMYAIIYTDILMEGTSVDGE